MALALIIELLVAVLLLVTIGYCVMLNRRLTRLRADEASLRGTIAELVTATEIAERAILGLKATAADCDRTLGQRLNDAQSLSATLQERITAGQSIVDRVSSIAEAVSRQPAPARVETPIQLPATDNGATRSLRSAAAIASARLKAMRAASSDAREAAE